MIVTLEVENEPYQIYIRLKDAPHYLGMNRNQFNRMVRPDLIEIPLGNKSIAFDILDLNAWADHYKQRNGRPAQRRSVWDKNERPVLPNGVKSGISTRKYNGVGSLQPSGRYNK